MPVLVNNRTASIRPFWAAIAASIFCLLAISAQAQSNVVVRVMAANLTGNSQIYGTPQLDILKGLKPDVVAIQEFDYTSMTTNGAQNRRPADARGPSAPRLPIPDHEPQMPTPAGASSGSGSSGGPHDGSTLGVTAAVLDITPRDGTRPITLIELCRRPVPLAFLLDRPG